MYTNTHIFLSTVVCTNLAHSFKVYTIPGPPLVDPISTNYCRIALLTVPDDMCTYLLVRVPHNRCNLINAVFAVQIVDSLTQGIVPSVLYSPLSIKSMGHAAACAFSILSKQFCFQTCFRITALQLLLCLLCYLLSYLSHQLSMFQYIS